MLSAVGSTVLTPFQFHRIIYKSSNPLIIDMLIKSIEIVELLFIYKMFVPDKISAIGKS